METRNNNIENILVNLPEGGVSTLVLRVKGSDLRLAYEYVAKFKLGSSEIGFFRYGVDEIGENLYHFFYEGRTNIGCYKMWRDALSIAYRFLVTSGKATRSLGIEKFLNIDNL